MDEIRLDGLVFFGRHGANPEETVLGQRFRVNLAVTADLSLAEQSDHLADTINYSGLYKLCRAEVEGEPCRILEHLAGRIVRQVFDYDERIKSVSVQVTKTAPPLRGSETGEVSVVLRRERA